MQRQVPAGFQVLLVKRAKGKTRTVPVGQLYTVREAAEQLAAMYQKQGAEAMVRDVYA
jgi:hypothetical protein